jgi:hypothetical protein
MYTYLGPPLEQEAVSGAQLLADQVSTQRSTHSAGAYTSEVSPRTQSTSPLRSLRPAMRPQLQSALRQHPNIL